MQIPYEGITLAGYFYKAAEDDTPRSTLVFYGGLDSVLEELWFVGGAAAQRRGYNVLTFDGPGQPKQLLDALTGPKQLIHFSAEEGAEEHCEAGAYVLAHQRMFDWLDEVLGLAQGAEPGARAA